MSFATRVLAGAMSGTSADGVDVALVEIAGRGLDMTARLIHHHHRAYDAALRSAIFRAREGRPVELQSLAGLGRAISLAYADAVNQAQRDAGMQGAQLAAVAAHGQTLYHAPPDTIQWLDPALIAARVGSAVVSDFRRADCAAGGQGAPLVPFADFILFRHPTKSRVTLNIGGIANITYLKAGGTLDDVVAFDTGPGNCVSDHLCRTRGAAGQSWDIDGRGASSGRVQPALLEASLAAPYFQAPFPKSTDVPAMVRLFEDALAAVPGSTELNDLLATAAQLTARTIHRGISAISDGEAEVIASGGGIANKAITNALGEMRAPRLNLVNSEDAGWNPQAREAVAFALLAAATLDGVPSNVPSATGAARAVVLGSITPRP